MSGSEPDKKIFVCSFALAHEISILLAQAQLRELLTYNYSTGQYIKVV
ncbi:MAG: hypothetical protein F6K24_54750 [Okeania sp. SIO2D1]|nr:hypothetical protein [Okeania sp. SIO2D1]